MRSSDAKTEKLVLAGILTAATLVLSLVSFPGGAGYLNLGDAAVLLTGTILGGGWGAVCAAVGSALADALLGYTVYIPCTVAVKAGASVLTSVLYKRMPSKWLPFILALSALIQVIGYFLFEWALMGFAAAVGDIFFNCIQAFVGATVAYIFMGVAQNMRNRHNRISK